MESRGTGRTTSDGVRDSYYGLPVVKAPHWRWLVIFYFFFGALSGAAFTVATVADLFALDRSIARLARYISVAALLPCPPLLILDLGRPERFMNMLRIVKLKSPMSLGSWALSFHGAFAVLAAGIHAWQDLTGSDAAGLRRLVGIMGLPFSIFLSGYTGVLLAATNIPIWWRSSPYIAGVFVSSAFSTALTTISVLLPFAGLESPDTERKLARAEVAVLATELSLLSAMLLRLGSIGRPLRSGAFGMIFWPVTFIGGLVIPLILHLSGPARGRHVLPARRLAAAGLALAGALSLRALMVLAGHHSAARPEDYFALTRGKRS